MSIRYIVGINILVYIYALLTGWDYQSMLFFYYAETSVIGFYLLLLLITTTLWQRKLKELLVYLPILFICNLSYVALFLLSTPALFGYDIFTNAPKEIGFLFGAQHLFINLLPAAWISVTEVITLQQMLIPIMGIVLYYSAKLLRTLYGSTINQISYKLLILSLVPRVCMLFLVFTQFQKFLKIDEADSMYAQYFFITILAGAKIAYEIGEMYLKKYGFHYS